MKKIYIDLDTGRKIADSLPELDTMQSKPERVGAYLVPQNEDYSDLDSYSRKQRVPIW